MSWKDEKTIRAIEIILIVGTLIWAAAFLRADVNYNTQWNQRQDEVHEEFMRKDVMRQVLIRLERIEQKIDEME